MSTTLSPNAPETDDPDVDVGAMLRELGADSIAPTPTRGMRTRLRRREAETAALFGPHTQPGTALARVKNDYFQPMFSSRELDDEYDESEEGSQVASI